MLSVSLGPLALPVAPLRLLCAWIESWTASRVALRRPADPAAAQPREAQVGFVFVNQGEPEAAVRADLASLGLPLREVLLDPGSTLGPTLGSRGLPTTLFYDAQGRLVDAHFGVLNAPALRSRLRALHATP